MPCESLEYKRHELLPASSGGQWTVLIRRPDEVLFRPEVARADDYQHAVWQAQRIVDRLSDEASARALTAR